MHPTNPALFFAVFVVFAVVLGASPEAASGCPCSQYIEPHLRDLFHEDSPLSVVVFVSGETDADAQTSPDSPKIPSPKVLEILGDTLAERVAFMELEDSTRQGLYQPLRVVEPPPMWSLIGDACLQSAPCWRAFAQSAGASHAVTLRVAMRQERPHHTLTLLSVVSGETLSRFEFTSNKNLKRQQKELGPALYKLLGVTITCHNYNPLGMPCQTDEDCQNNLTCVPVDDRGSYSICVVRPPPLVFTEQAIWATTLGTVGVAALSAGGALGWHADDLQDRVKQGIKRADMTQTEAQALLADSQNNALGANILYATGGAAILSAALILLWPTPHDDPEPSATTQVQWMPWVSNNELGGALHMRF